ncbi:MarR family transcriptional regulator [Rhodoplanes elegans]|uniref:MarR family transcriptional regulator n=1 Tax=Rhodoplanes elegans TaxID=29408 RepID=A0A327KYR9_9BRAD|nr:MarR family winged helix-turn-helix transcriptional regulator [Rhodoplanes elegans]MBK5960293.1 MarR family transcriptional regulator [Rhodoplanes elegans]RAI42332.1 MarR family transcriptional regulator [Rhodoplanes elegans]
MLGRFHETQTSEGDALTALMLETFRLNGRLLAAGDRLVAPIGLTSARWQVLGAIAMAGRGAPVAHIARDMGLTRQSVQRVVDVMAAEGLVGFAANPHHRRAKLVVLSAHGRATYDAAILRHVGWSNGLADGLIADGLSADDIVGATAVMRTLVARLEAALAAGDETGPETRSGAAGETVPDTT